MTVLYQSFQCSTIDILEGVCVGGCVSVFVCGSGGVLYVVYH